MPPTWLSAGLGALWAPPNTQVPLVSRAAQVAGTFHLHTHTPPSCLLPAVPWDISHQELPLEGFQTSVFIGLPTASKNTEYYFTASSNLHMLRENGSASVNETISITPGQFQLTQRASTLQLGSDGCKWQHPSSKDAQPAACRFLLSFFICKVPQFFSCFVFFSPLRAQLHYIENTDTGAPKHRAALKGTASAV